MLPVEQKYIDLCEQRSQRRAYYQRKLDVIDALDVTAKRKVQLASRWLKILPLALNAIDRDIDRHLCDAIKSGGKAADASTEILIGRNRRSIDAVKKHRRGLSVEEVEVRSLDAVWRAARTYDPGKGAAFTTHLHSWLNRNSRARTKGDKHESLIAEADGIRLVSGDIPHGRHSTGKMSVLFDSVSADASFASLGVSKAKNSLYTAAQQSRLRSILKAMSETHRKILTGLYFEKKTSEDLGTELDMSAEAVEIEMESAFDEVRSKMAV